LAGIDHEPADGLLARTRQPGDGADGTALTEQVKDAGSLRLVIPDRGER
jgi:hypothetical protein